LLVLFAAILVASSGAALLQSQTVHAQSWPSSWTWIDSDANENGPFDDYRDVRDAYLSFDSEHLYLRMRLWGTPHFSGDARYKWLIDVGVAPNLYMPDHNILGSEYILFVEDDNPEDGTGEVYLLPASPDDSYGDYEPGLYKAPPYGPVSDNTIAGYRFDTDGSNYYVDMYVKLSALGQSDAYGISLWWATDQENPNLEQGPTTDVADAADAPFTITSPHPGPTPRAAAAYPGIYIGMGSALGVGVLAYLTRRRVARQQD
jgi:hypothetical protein